LLSKRQRIVQALGGTARAWSIATAIAVGTVVHYRPAIALLVGLTVAIPIERRWRRHAFGALRPDLGTDILHFLFSNSLKAAGIAAAAGVSWLALHRFEIEPVATTLHRLPSWANVVTAFAAVNFCYYWEHRLAHSWSFLWRLHSVHHSSSQLDWLSSTRLHPLEGFIGGFIITAPAILAGFNLRSLGVAGAVFAINDVLIHANVNWRLPRLSRWIPTPEYHHWHHSNEPQSYNKNFGWPVFDRMFGTFYLPADRRPATYGITEPVRDTYLAQLADPLRRSWPQPPAQQKRYQTT